MEQTMSEVTLFGFPRSVYVQMAGIVLTHKDVQYAFHDLETETTTLAGGQPILALDMFEHSYHIDYGARAAAYVDAFMAVINWANVALAYDRNRGAIRR
jgi:superoxide dismutase